jgi:type I restriction enzyme S subunit
VTQRLVENNLPNGWAISRIDDLSEKVTDGTHFTPEYLERGVPFISVKDIHDGKINFHGCKFIAPKAHAALAKRCNPEYMDVLITKSGTIGRIAVVRTKEPFSLFVSVALIKPFKEYLDSAFLSYALENYIKSIDIQQSVKGGVIKNLHVEDLKEIKLPIAPLEEQHRIVSKVEELFSFLDVASPRYVRCSAVKRYAKQF